MFRWLSAASTVAYVPGVPGPRPAGVLELAANENVLGASPLALASGRRALLDTHLYPEADAGSLRHRLAERWALPVESVLVTPGTTALIDQICRAFLDTSAAALVPERSFLAYTTSVAATGARLVAVPLRDDHVDLDAVLAHLDADVRLVFLANPNNPTGTAFRRAAFDRFIAQIPANVLVILDEAYAEYGDDLPIGADHVRAGAPVLALRTFSKVHGLAGLRVGYGLGPPAIVARLARLTGVFAVSHAAQRAAEAALDDAAHVDRSVGWNRTGRERLTAGLVRLGLSPAPSAANFVYVELGRPAEPVRDRLLAAGVRVRALAAWGAPNALRITVGHPEQVERTLAALGQILASNKLEDR